MEKIRRWSWVFSLFFLLMLIGVADYMLWGNVHQYIPNELAYAAPIGFTIAMALFLSSFWIKKRVWLRKSFRGIALLGVLLSVAGVVVVDMAYVSVRNSFSDIQLKSVTDYTPVMTTRVFDIHGREICRFTRENRMRVELADISPKIQKAFIAAEDGDFYAHAGIDVKSIIRAMVVNLESGKTKQGASTITQQVLKRIAVGKEKTFGRKALEAVGAIEVEKILTKEQILEIYLNEIYLGNNAYGVEEASRMYFNKPAKDVTWAEAAMLAGLAKAPASDSPHRHQDEASERYAYVLGRLFVTGMITLEERNAIKETPINLAKNAVINPMEAPYACEEIRRDLLWAYGEKKLYEEGLLVYSTIDMRMQQIAQDVVMNGLETYEKVVGDGEKNRFLGPTDFNAARANGECIEKSGNFPVGVRDANATISAISKGGITMCVYGHQLQMLASDAKILLAWKKNGQTLRVGDVIPVRAIDVTEKIKKEERIIRYATWAPRTTKEDGDLLGRRVNPLQASLVAVDQSSGEVRAIVGGYDFYENQFNHATQGHPQVGSSIKPYVYLTGLMHGVTVADVMNDHAQCYSLPAKWCPANYSGYNGNVSLRTALASSLNSISVQILMQSGLSNVIETMTKLGIDTTGKSSDGGLWVPKHASIAVGSAAIPLWQQVMAYATIAANGKEMPTQKFGKFSEKNKDFSYRKRGLLVRKIVDKRGVVIFEQKVDVQQDQKQAVPADAAYALIYLMRGAIEDPGGTATRVRELGRPAAGKTGTSDSEKNVWFVGFTQDLVAGVWVGREMPEHIGNKATGGGVAMPFWLEFMKRVYALEPEKYPARDFPVPSEVVRVYRDGKMIPYLQGNVPEDVVSKVDVTKYVPLEPIEEEVPK